MRSTTDQFSAEYPERPEWTIGPFERDDDLTFRLEGQWDDPTGVGWTSDSIFNPTVIPHGGLHYVPFEELVDPSTLVTVVRHIEPDSDFQKLTRFLETYVNEEELTRRQIAWPPRGK